MYSERRRSFRQKVHAPAFAIFDGVTGGMILDLSQEGMSMQSAAAVEPHRTVKMRLDVVDPALLLETTGYIAWADALGRAGVRFSDLPNEGRQRLDEWLTTNAGAPSRKAPKLTLAATDYGLRGQASVDAMAITIEPELANSSLVSGPGSTTMQYEFTPLASDINAALRLIAERARSLTRGSGAAIALAHKESMICRASVGTCAPALGTRPDDNSRFSAECVRSGRTLRCDDAEDDPRVDGDCARGFGLRSILAAPVQYERGVVGLLEVFSTERCAFDDGDVAIVDRLARTILLTLSQRTTPVRS
jgi:hypothetical protein